MRETRMIFFIFSVITLIILSGCWDMREINELGIVTAVGIDKGDGPSKYSMTVQIANPTTENSSDGQDKSSNKVWVGTQEGESLIEAAREFMETSSRRLMWAHNNVVIIGEDLAREGIIPVVDFFTHNPELRMKTVVVVAKGKAKDYFTVTAGMETPSGVAFVLMESYRKLPAESTSSHMLNISSRLKAKFGNPLISEVYLEKALIKTDEGGAAGKEMDLVNMTGAAVFKKDKMVGWLSPEETRGTSWILGQTHGTIMTATDPKHENTSVSVETRGFKTEIKAEVKGNMPNISIRIKGEGDIVEEDGVTSEDITEMKENIAALIDKEIEDEVKNSLEIIQKKYKVDCLGLAAIVHTQNNKEWDTLSAKWEEIFPYIPVTVTADIKIESSTLNQDPMKIY